MPRSIAQLREASKRPLSLVLVPVPRYRPPPSFFQEGEEPLNGDRWRMSSSSAPSSSSRKKSAYRMLPSLGARQTRTTQYVRHDTRRSSQRASHPQPERSTRKQLCVRYGSNLCNTCSTRDSRYLCAGHIHGLQEFSLQNSVPFNNRMDEHSRRKKRTATGNADRFCVDGSHSKFVCVLHVGETVVALGHP